MSQENFNAIFGYLEQNFPNSEIETIEYSESDIGRFKIHVEGRTVLLKVSMELLLDKTSEEILALLERWGTINHLAANIGKGVYAKTTGLTLFDRD